MRYAAGAVAGDALIITVLVNASGSFGLGLLVFGMRADGPVPRRVRHLVGTGIFASFTTYSTFVADIALSTRTIALAYLAASYAAGFGGVIASRWLASSHDRSAKPHTAEGED